VEEFTESVGDMDDITRSLAIPTRGSYLLRASTLIDGVSPQPATDVVVQVSEGGDIEAVDQPNAFGERVAEAVHVPVLMPGLIDCHAHVTLPSDRRSIPEQLQVSDARLALTAVRQLGLHLYAGYTTVRDCGARGSTTLDVRSAARAGDFPAPRLLVSGRAITPSGGHLAWCGAVADSHDEMRRQIRLLSSEGADAIKLIASGGSTGGSPFRASYTPEELRVAVQAAHTEGLMTIAHARSSESIANCIEAGIDVIAHLEFLRPGPIEDIGGGAPTGIPSYDPAVGRRLADARPWLDLNPQSSGWDTLVVLREAETKGELRLGEVQAKAGLERYFEGMLNVISSLRGLGLADRMAFGSDAGPFDTEFGRPEYNLELAWAAGLDPMEAVRALTFNAAGACGWQDEIGAIRPRLRADMLALAEDPLRHPYALRSVLAVIVAGRTTEQQRTQPVV
jgi:imidazolonepropionase-like amidohydrolase